MHLWYIVLTVVNLPYCLPFDWSKYVHQDILSRQLSEAETRLLNATRLLQARQGGSPFDFYLPFPPPPAIPSLFIKIEKPPDVILPLIMLSFLANNVVLLPVPMGIPCPLCPIPSPLKCPTSSSTPTTSQPVTTAIQPIITITQLTSTTHSTTTNISPTTAQTTLSTTVTQPTITTQPTTEATIATTKCPPLEPLPPPQFPPVNCPAGDRLCQINPAQPAVLYSINQFYNIIRRSIAATDMKKMEWNHDIYKLAQSHAEGCSFTKQQPDVTLSGVSCNQNILKTDSELTWENVIKQWNNTGKDFKYGEPSPNAEPFMQMIWATSTKVGCSVAKCSGGIFYVCNYCPADKSPEKANKPFTPGPSCGSCECQCEDSLCVEPDHEDNE